MTVAIVCALEWELEHLRRLLPGGTGHLTNLGHESLVLVASGMGMAKSAAAAQRVLCDYAPRAMFNYGCAGAHRAELLPGDLVVADRLVAYEDIHESPADPNLLSLAREVVGALADKHEPWPLELGWPEGIAHRPPRVVFGTVASADRWNRSAATIAALVERHNSLCEDMEAAAIAMLCATNHVPFLSIKDISNNELLRPTQSGAAMLAEIGPDELARRAAALTFAILQHVVTE